ncbi:MAG: hypothetical protein QQN55_03675 [Nitrosopumilus sp.]
MTTAIEKAAETVGIAAFVTDSENRLETQLNKLTRDIDDPIMLISWDINTNLNFDANGFLDNPLSNIVALLLAKAEDGTRDEQKSKSDEMGLLFQKFIKQLFDDLVLVQTTTNAPITGASYIAVPRYGSGVHSGILAKWTMKSAIVNCT